MVLNMDARGQVVVRAFERSRSRAILPPEESQQVSLHDVIVKVGGERIAGVPLEKVKQNMVAHANAYGVLKLEMEKTESVRL